MHITKKIIHRSALVSLILVVLSVFQVVGFHLHQPEVVLVDSARKKAFWCRAANDQSYFRRGTRRSYLFHALRTGWRLGAPESGGFVITEVLGVLDLEKALQMEREEMAELRANDINLAWPTGLRWVDYGYTDFVNPQFRGEIVSLKEGPVSSVIVSMIAEMTRMKPDDVRHLAHPCIAVLHSEVWNNGKGKPFSHIVINDGCVFYQTFWKYNSY